MNWSRREYSCNELQSGNEVKNFNMGSSSYKIWKIFGFFIEYYLASNDLFLDIFS
jgi:hypothetical protein